MPSGKTHDRVTLWLIPWVALVSIIATEHWGHTALITGGFVFAGLMFGPDLDIHSVQTKRWGWLAWIWRPYRRSLRHRSWLSHGFLAGTVVRLLYLLVWSLLVTLIILEVSNTQGYTTITWADLGSTLQHMFATYWPQWVAIAIGIELGAMSHYTADWFVSAWKREARKSAPKKRSPKRIKRRPRSKSRK